MLGMEVEEDGGDIQDALGEIANMVAGEMKQAVSPKGTEVQLSTPSVVYGEKYTLDVPANGSFVGVELETVHGPVQVMFIIEEL